MPWRWALSQRDRQVASALSEHAALPARELLAREGGALAASQVSQASQASQVSQVRKRAGQAPASSHDGRPAQVIACKR